MEGVVEAGRTTERLQSEPARGAPEPRVRRAALFSYATLSLEKSGLSQELLPQKRCWSQGPQEVGETDCSEIQQGGEEETEKVQSARKSFVNSNKSCISVPRIRVALRKDSAARL